MEFGDGRTEKGERRMGETLGYEVKRDTIGGYEEAVAIKVASVGRFFLHTSVIISYSYSCLV